MAVAWPVHGMTSRRAREGADSVVMNWLFGRAGDRAGAPGNPGRRGSGQPDGAGCRIVPGQPVHQCLRRAIAGRGCGGRPPDHRHRRHRPARHQGSGSRHPRQGFAERDPAGLPADHAAHLPGAGPGDPEPAGQRTAARPRRPRWQNNSTSSWTRRTEVLDRGPRQRRSPMRLVAQGSFLRTKFGRSELDL